MARGKVKKKGALPFIELGLLVSCCSALWAKHRQPVINVFR
jgi:hypothetical protein